MCISQEYGDVKAEAADSSRARTYYVLLSVAPGECAG